MNTEGKIFLDDTAEYDKAIARRDRMLELSKAQAEVLQQLPEGQRVGHFANHFTNTGHVGSKMLKALVKKNKNFQKKEQ